MPILKLSDFEKQAKEAGGSNIYFKVTDTPTVFVPRGDAYSFYQNFATKQLSETPITGFSWKFKINVAILQDGVWQSKILQGGSTLAGQIAQHMTKFGRGHAFAVHKKGKMKETEYFVIYEKKLSENEMMQVDSLKQYGLAPKGSANQISDMPEPPENHSQDADVPY